VPDIDDSGVAALPARERELAVWEKLGLLLSACERRADDASRDVEAWLKCWFVKERVGEVFSGRVTGVASFGIFITLDTLFVEGMVHVSELGSDYFQYNEAMNELRGERTGMRYRLTDAVQVQVSRVDLEARRIEFRLVKGTGFKRSKQRLTRIRPTSAAQDQASSASQTAALKGTARQRRAEAKRSAKGESAPHKGQAAGTVDDSPQSGPRHARPAGLQFRHRIYIPHKEPHVFLQVLAGFHAVISRLRHAPDSHQRALHRGIAPRQTHAGPHPTGEAVACARARCPRRPGRLGARHAPSGLGSAGPGAQPRHGRGRSARQPWDTGTPALLLILDGVTDPTISVLACARPMRRRSRRDCTARPRSRPQPDRAARGLRGRGNRSVPDGD